jgi:hypothetical protein
MFGKKRSPTKSAASVPRCSFCNKSQDDVQKLIAGPSVYICDECVEVCEDIIAREREQSTVNVTDEQTTNETPLKSVPVVQCPLCRMPMSVGDGVMVGNRGMLCPACVGEVQAIRRERQK